MEAGNRFVRVVSTCKNLDIPGDIALQMQGDDVILRDRYENLWCVGVARSGEEWCFKNGWGKVYKENSLEPYDVMVFEYKGGKLFDFKLLGLDACDKKGHLKFKGKEKAIDDEDREEYKMKSSHSSRRDLRGEGPNKRNHGKRNVTGKKGVGARTHKGKEAEEEQENITEKIKPTSQSKSSPHAHQIIPPDCGGRGAEWYGADTFESGAIPRPTNPFFVTRSRTPRRKNDLYIPIEVIKDYQLKIPETLTVVDEHDRKWETKIKVWKDGRVWCSRGWGSLCNVNNIGKDDACICEFVQGENSDDLCIKVRRVSRAG